MLLLLLRSWKDLRSEVARVRSELGQKSHQQNQANTWVKILSSAKGPVGVITLVAVVLVFGQQLLMRKPETKTTAAIPQQTRATIKVIVFGGKQIPLDALIVGTGADCDAPHYHAKDHTSAKALDGTTVSDPGGCGFGRVSQVTIVEVEQ